MDQKEREDILRKRKAVVEGHFVLTSGRHGDTYIQCAKILQDPPTTALVMAEIIGDMRNKDIDLVIGPATGGIILAYEAARQLGVEAIFTEREKGEMVLRRGFDIPLGARVFVVEDVVTTGGSVQEVLKVVKEKGGQAVAIGVLADRTGGEIDFGVPTYSVFSKKIISYAPSECPLCIEGLPTTKPGSRGL